jgi:hypothetical protein
MKIKLLTHGEMPANTVITQITSDDEDFGPQIHFGEESDGVHFGEQGCGSLSIECCTKDFVPAVGDKIHIWTNEVYGFVITKGHTDKMEMEIDESLLFPLEK